LPAAADFDSDAIAGLLLALVEDRIAARGDLTAAQHLCKQLSSKQLKFLLGACMQLTSHAYSSTRFADAVCELPGAQQLSSGELVQLLQAAISAKGAGYTSQLGRLPAAAGISGADATSLVCAAFITSSSDVWMQHVLGGVASDLVRLPAIAQLNSMEIRQLLQVAVSHSDPNSGYYLGLQFLCGLPAAQQLTSEEVAQLLQAAFACKSGRCITAVMTLPGKD
jgi:hypothetical protein